MAALAGIADGLLGPGGAFELADAQVHGCDVPTFVNRRAALVDWLVDSAALDNRPCLVQGDRTLSFADHAAVVASLAAVLAEEYRVGPGDRVAIVAANSPDWLLSFWAGIALGAVVVAGNAWWSASEAEYSLRRTAPTVVVADGKRAALIESFDDFDVPILRTADIARLVTSSSPQQLPDIRPSTDDPAVVVFTSGTTGHPKGAVHSHGNLLSVIEYHRYTDAMLDASGALFGRPPRQVPRRFLMSLPLFHIASLHNLAIPRLASGDTVVIDEGRFDVDRVLRLIEREKVTNWAVVPTMAHRLASHGPLTDYDLSSLTALSINSAPSSPALKERVRGLVPGLASLADSYGLTEASTAATVATPVDLGLHPTTVGAPIPSVAISVRSAVGAELPDREEGEVWLRSQFTMLGYWDDPAATAAMIDADGWVHTGDLGSMRDGRLFMASRRSDLILRGGENVYPAEIEATLDEHPAVAECAVFGVDDEDLGQAVAVVVVCSSAAAMQPGPMPDEADLRIWLSERLAYYKVPAHWRITTEPMARTATGKVIRRALHV